MVCSVPSPMGRSRSGWPPRARLTRLRRRGMWLVSSPSMSGGLECQRAASCGRSCTIMRWSCITSTSTLSRKRPSSRRFARVFIMQPGYSPPPAVTQDDDRRPRGGEERVRPWPPPCPQLQGCSSSVLGRRVRRVGARLRVGSGPLLPSVIGREGRSPFVALEAVACLAPGPERLWRCFWCRLLSLGRSVAARPPHGCQSHLARADHVQVLLAPSAAPGGRTTRRTPRGWYSCSGTASARTGVRTCRCTLGRPPFAGAVLVGRWPLSSVLRWWSP
jgi:hypothetical protein